MRRWFLAIIVAFIGGSAICIILETPSEDVVSLITLDKRYSRMITKAEETISIPVYISMQDTFLLDPALIDTVALVSEDVEMSVEISDIRDAEVREELEGTDYHLYYFDIGFPDEIKTDYTMNFLDAELSITYQNLETISLEIGSLSLRFSDLEENAHLSLNRMYVVTNQSEIIPSVQGIVISLEDRTLGSVTLIDLDIGCNEIHPDLEHAIPLETAIDYHGDLEELMGYEYQRIGTVEAGEELLVSNSELWFIPFRYTSEIVPIERFPLYVTYQIYGQVYHYDIDDFQFYQQSHCLEVYYGSLRECIYYYQ
ncbi:MAG: hypothetical protein JXB08_04580 [Bacilli bacterium]|nr:hypothetical protein [Bacilli bacterium]MBN2877380.1 hypothetical protein [Bacilli bacterium]